jgi:hypothetical protein
MALRNRMLLAALALSAATISLPAAAATFVDIKIAPPAPHVEIVPGPRPGYVWAPGYWRWNGHRHIWVRGGWIRERHGWRWEPQHWVQTPNGRWHFVQGRWVR